ncbi:hypothetical protein PHMEG_00025557 [Phytophthora megakarya]|uniref:Uncharacterized protein n=1 Tax=Phytophthora megakarya TaxID=4795 RepID=A0A225VBB6_9STRA|nr:hypothetical protein PHMEG_00025557 [Phytophthora megakarya]
MRVQRTTYEGTATETQSLLAEKRKLPQDMILSTEDGQDKASVVIDNVYDGLGERYLEDDYFADRAILTLLNVDVLKLNDSYKLYSGEDQKICVG